MPSAIRRRHFPCCGLVRVLLENRHRNIACFALGETETLDSKRNQGFLFLLWYHQESNHGAAMSATTAGRIPLKIRSTIGLSLKL